MPRYPIDPRRSALILFDMLEHYLRPDDPERARQVAASGVLENTPRLLAVARAAGMAAAAPGKGRGEWLARGAGGAGAGAAAGGFRRAEAPLERLRGHPP